jgi:hypothetical protein
MFILKNIKIEAKRTRSIDRKFISKRSEHVYINELKIEAKRTRSKVRKFILKRSENVYIKELKNRSEAKPLSCKL